MIYPLYNGTINLSFNPSNHIYSVEGAGADGVTGAVSILDKSRPLMIWAVDMAMAYVREHIKPGEALDEIALLSITDAASMQHLIYKKKAADIGTLTHDWIERWIKGEKPGAPINMAMKNATDAFQKWVSEHSIKFLSTERKVYSKKYCYAGTLDFISILDGKELVVGDIKTSKHIYDDMRYQVAAYRYALAEEINFLKSLPVGTIVEAADRALVEAYEKCGGFGENLVVRIGKELSEEGKIALETKRFDEYERDIEAFFACLILYRRRKQLMNMVRPIGLKVVKG